MKNSIELRAELDALEAEVRELADLEDINDEQDARFDELTDLVPATRSLISKAEAREALAEEARSRPTVPAEFGINKGVEAHAEVDARNASPAEVRDAAFAQLERAESIVADTRHLDAAEKLLKRGNTSAWDATKYARQLAITESDVYRDAWLKTVSGREAELSENERRTLSEARAMSLTDTSGGFAVPVVIDPTVLITDGTGLTGLLDYVRVESVNNDAWKGVSAAHTVWGGRAEGAEAGDDSSTFAQPAVNVHTTDAFVPASIEITQDFPGFANEVGKLIADGYMDFVAEQLAIGAGDGSNEGWGIFTTTTTTIDVTTDNTFGADDIDAVYAGLPEKFRANSIWFMNVGVESQIRAFGSGTATSRFTVDQTAEGISKLNGKDVVTSDWAPDFTGTDGAAVLVAGDFSNFLFAQRVGMTMEYIPHLFGTTNARPTGQRGWYAYARYGHDKIVLNAFRKLKNQTT